MRPVRLQDPEQEQKKSKEQEKPEKKEKEKKPKPEKTSLTQEEMDTLKSRQELVQNMQAQQSLWDHLWQIVVQMFGL